MNKSQSVYPILYKYLDIDGAKKMLSNSNLQYTNATKFNDPFDSHPSLIDSLKFPLKCAKHGHLILLKKLSQIDI